MTDTHEFGSPGWLQATCDIIEKQIAASGVDLRGLDYTFGEEFFNIPARLSPTGAERVGWYLRIADGAITTATVPPPPDADGNNIADWDAIEYLAHHEFGADPERDIAVAAEVAALEAEGKLNRVIRRERPDALTEAMGGGTQAVHNAVVAITGPRQS